MKNAHQRYCLRKERIKKKIRGSSERPRLFVYRSLRQMYAQVIDDGSGNTMVSDSTCLKDFKSKNMSGKISDAQMVGERIAKKALSLGIKRVVFDRGGWPYHGRIKALAEAARKTGLEF